MLSLRGVCQAVPGTRNLKVIQNIPLGLALEGVCALAFRPAHCLSFFAYRKPPLAMSPLTAFTCSVSRPCVGTTCEATSARRCSFKVRPESPEPLPPCCCGARTTGNTSGLRAWGFKSHLRSLSNLGLSSRSWGSQTRGEGEQSSGFYYCCCCYYYIPAVGARCSYALPVTESPPRCAVACHLHC